MIPTKYNLPDAYRGDSYGPIIFEFFDKDNNPIDVTNADVKCTVGNIGHTRDREVVLSWPKDTHGISLSAHSVKLHSVSGEYMKMLPDIYYWDLQMTIDGYTKTFLVGNLTVVDEVTLNL